MIYVPDISAVSATYNRIKLYGSTTRTGSFSLVTTLTLASTTKTYTYTDTSTTNRWYKYSWFQTSGSVESALSEAFPIETGPVRTLRDLRIMGADKIECYGKPDTQYTMPCQFTTTSNGAADGSTVKSTSFANSRWTSTGSDTMWADWHIYLSAVSESRPIASYAQATGIGTFTMAQSFSAQVNSSVAFEIYGQGNVSWWNDRVNEARLDIWVPFEYMMVGESNVTRYQLPYFIQRKDQIKSIERRVGTVSRNWVTIPLDDWIAYDEPGSGVTLDARFGVDDVIIVRGFRNPPHLLNDTDEVVLSDEFFYIWNISTAMRAAQRLGMQFGEIPENRERWLKLTQMLDEERRARWQEIGPWTPFSSPRSTRMVGVASSRTRRVKSQYY